jgi:hypothetical protein
MNIGRETQTKHALLALERRSAERADIFVREVLHVYDRCRRIGAGWVLWLRIKCWYSIRTLVILYLWTENAKKKFKQVHLTF